MVKTYQYLTQDQIDLFMKRGFLRVKNAFDAEKAAIYTNDVWVRLGMDPDDKSTWTKERINMPQHRNMPTVEFAPKAWGAICELLGGEDRISDEHKTWGDALIVNLGKPEYEGKAPPDPHELDNWHCDGDFFRHFLDSPEQGLLVVPLFGDIKPTGGGTMIATDGVQHVAKFLAEHPGGILPGSEGQRTGQKFDFRDLVSKCHEFEELHGELGDVVLMHPLMLHSASRNMLRIPRIITNPPVSLKEPFKFSRENPDDYSLVELKTIQDLGADPKTGGYKFEITHERHRVYPDRLKVQIPMKEAEEKRLAAMKAKMGVNENAVPAVVATAVH